MQHSRYVLVLALLGVFALACEAGADAGPAPTGKPRPARPSSMAALGDSITAGTASCAVYVGCSRNSWSTGSAEAVDSHYRRLLETDPALKGRARNFAVPGAQAADLPAQAASAVDAGSAYVTILIGANDVCAGGVDDMTSVRTFRSHVDKAFGRLKRGLPESRILVASIPDVYRLWELGHDDAKAVQAWRRGVCPAMLANATSTADADDDRRRRVDERIDAYNDQLAQACEAYGRRCRWDGGAAHGVRFSLDLVSKADYFHPNVAGQNRLADVTYPGRITW
ncbi:lysophospholipase L1-like esterase [Couchioplanes caeruleus]|uniref:GDSL family lipase n=2 Tax=Couchioplanes caeruleus TaxID=56438 RepID=A0A1K0FTA4_9ACTN|nr:GDSL family lipase [Couchioplanes caeruleus subsp. caeruleus]OJF16045.1 GDSL family lipase [Couchioplanes caeruleus subsp. caeruleus]ROP27818.1 lysophospholipase L1-like esterase [Couchioplanes caeruleus]